VLPRNVLIWRRKFFLRTTKNRPADPSEIALLIYKNEFRRSAICPALAAVGIDWSVLKYSANGTTSLAKKSRQPLRTAHPSRA
jgi:hypothetical protein